MKADRKTKAENSSPKIKAVKGSRRLAASKTNGKHPLRSYEHLPIGLVESSPDGKYVNVNEEFCRITGYQRQELLTLGIKDITHEDDYMFDINLHERLVAGKIPFYKIEKRIRRKDGSAIWVELTRSVARDSAGEALYTIGTVLDISDRKHVERVLRESVEQLRLATGTAQMFMWEWDFLNHSYILADNFEQVIGFSAGLLSKNNIDTLPDLIPAEDIQSISEAYEQAIEHHRDLHSLPCRVINPKTSEIVWLEVSAKIVYEDDGMPVRMFGVAQNITESKRAEASLQLARKHAERSADRTARLQKVTAALSEALTPPQVADVLANQGAPAFGAVSSSMMLLSEDGQTLELMYSTTPESITRPYRQFPVSLKVPAADAVRSGQTVWIESREQYLERYPHLADQIHQWGQHAAVAIPMVYKDRILGVLTLSFDQVLPYNPEDQDYALTLTRQGAQALERARAEDALRDSEERLRALVSQATAGITQVDLNGRLTFANQKIAEMLGYTESELMGKTIQELTYTEDWVGHRASFEQLSQDGRPFEVEQRLVRYDGSTIWTSLSMSPLLDADGKIQSSIAVVIDITKRKFAEDWERLSAANLLAAAEANAKFRTFFEQGSYFAGVMTVDGTVVEANRLSLEFAGFTREDVIGKKFWDCGWWSPSPELMEMIRTGTKEAAEGKIFRQESNYFMADGSERYVDLIISPVTDETDRLLFLAPTGTDITERKRMEDAIRESEERFRALVSQATAGITETDMDSRLTFVNPTFCKMLGYTEEELLGRTIWELTHTDDLEVNKRLFQRMLSEGESYQVEKRFIRKDGTRLWTNVSVSTIRDLEIQPKGGVGVVIDIEKRKRAEEALTEFARQQEALYKLSDQLHRTESPEDVFNAALDAILSALQCDRASILLFDDADVMRFVAWRGLSDNYRRATDGHSPWKPDAKYPEPICMDDVRTAELSDSLRATIQGEGIGSLAFIPLVSNGNLIGKFMIYFDAPHRFEEGEVDLSLTIAHQLAFGIERKRAEAALRESEQRYRTLFDSIDEGFCVIEKVNGEPGAKIDFRYIEANPAFAIQAGVGGVAGKTIREAFPGEPEEWFETYDHILQTGKPVKFERGLITQGRVLELYAFRIDDGTNRRVAVVFNDITERKQAEEALRESEERFRAILRQATAGIVRKDVEGRLIFVNQAFCNMLGYTESELLGKRIWDFMHPDDVAENKRLYERMMMEGTPLKLERRLMREDGSIIWVDASVSPIMDVTGKPQSVVAVEVDITGRKQAEEALQQLNLQLEDRVLSRTAKLRAVNQTLREEIAERKKVEEALRESETTARENEEKLSTLFELLPVGISFLDLEGQIIQMNSALTNILKLSREKLFGQSYESRNYIRANGTLMPPLEFASRRALTEGRTIYNVETGVILEDSEVIWTSVSAAPVDVADVGAVVVTVDITESKRAERALEESRERLQILSQRLVEVQEDERRAIARELHDRVGQTLAALNINLIIISGQLGGQVDEQIGTRLNDSMKLVAETISLVRDVMSNLRPSVLDDYGLEAAIESHLSQFISRYEIRVNFEKPDQPIPRLGSSIEMTFLRIAQESLMNIARHAQATQVNLSLRGEKEAICMTIKDNGIGIQSWQDANRPGSHGLTIMRERAEAFGGSLNVSSVPGQGTQVEVRIPVENSSPPQAGKEIRS